MTHTDNHGTVRPDSTGAEADGVSPSASSPRTAASRSPRWDDRRHDYGGPDQRAEGARDRDRVLYASALRRLASVTQVVGPLEGYTFHNRLTHTLETAQIARRLAERLCAEQAELAHELGRIDPETVEAAALIHDLGHPPFGHVGEEQLNALALKKGDSDGFEGNAQSFRVVTRLAAHRKGYAGLNLTRATLNASLKYPNLRDTSGRDKKKSSKFGAYQSDADDLRFAREGFSEDVRSVEAEIMDYADDVAYSVHDLDDFVRSGLIPIERLRDSQDEFDEFIENWKEWARSSGRADEAVIEANRGVAQNFLVSTFRDVVVAPTFRQRAIMRTVTAGLIRSFVLHPKLQPRDAQHRGLLVAEERQFILKFCQRTVWHYVIGSPRLASQQLGQRAIVKKLFEVYHEAAAKGDKNLVPARFHSELDGMAAQPSGPVRLAVDIITSLSDDQAVSLYRRITGTSPGSVTELLAG